MNKIDKILIILNGAFAAWATFTFLVLLKLDPLSWIMLNTCSPTQFAVILTLVSERRVLMNSTAPWLLFYGFGGLLIFGWSGYMIVAQISHLTMTATVIYVLMTTAKERRFKALAAGLAMGALALVPFRLYQDQFLSTHPELLRLLGME